MILSYLRPAHTAVQVSKLIGNSLLGIERCSESIILGLKVLYKGRDDKIYKRCFTSVEFDLSTKRSSQPLRDCADFSP